MAVLPQNVLTSWMLAFQGATMWNLQAVNKLEDGTGLPTDMITMNVSVQLTMRNPNSRFTTFCDGGILQIGYATFDPLMQAGVSRSWWMLDGPEIRVAYANFPAILAATKVRGSIK